MFKRITSMLVVLGFGGLTCAYSASYKVLVFTAANSTYSSSIKASITKMVQDISKTQGFTVDVANSPSALTLTNLKQYRLVLWNCNAAMGKVLSEAQKSAFLQYMNEGGGYVGFFYALNQQGGWPAYSDMIGADMVDPPANGHPWAPLNVETAAKTHPITQGLDAKITITEKWYAFRKAPTALPGVQVLYTADETGYKYPPAPAMGYHPAIWVRTLPGGGRIYYNQMGYKDTTFTIPWVRNQTAAAIKWVANAAPTALAPSRDLQLFTGEKYTLRILPLAGNGETSPGGLGLGGSAFTLLGGKLPQRTGVAAQPLLLMRSHP